MPLLVKRGHADQGSGARLLRMSEPLTFVSHDIVHFRPYDTGRDLKYFAIQPEVSDRSLLADLLEHGQYHDHYAGQDPTEQSHHSLHGPYRLEAITAGVFEPVRHPGGR